MCAGGEYGGVLADGYVSVPADGGCALGSVACPCLALGHGLPFLACAVVRDCACADVGDGECYVASDVALAGVMHSATAGVGYDLAFGLHS